MYLSILKSDIHLFFDLGVSVNGTPLQLLDFEASPIHSKSNPPQASSSSMTDIECRHHIDKLKILNLVANLKGEPSPDDYEKDICVSINETFVSELNEKPDETHLNNGVVDWIKSVEHDSSQLEAIAHISPSVSPAKTDCSPVKCGNGTVHREIDTMTSSKGSQDLLSVSVQSTEKSESSAEKDEHNDVFIDSIKDCTAKLSEQMLAGNEDLNDKKTTKTYASSVASSECHSSQYSTLKRKKRHSDSSKPPNVLVYSESNDIRANVISTIKNILHPDRYTIYELKAEQLKTNIWIDNTTLLIVCGPISTQLGSILMEYFLCGGKMLCLCSDVLNMVLPIYRTAEVRENELVQFSYGRWQKIQLMHHIFCYHPSPIKKHFSLENEEEGQQKP